MGWKRRRRFGNPDRNQGPLVKLARRMGVRAEITTGVGGGAPDLMLGVRGVNLWCDVKQPGKPLRTNQRTWHERWTGQCAVIETGEDLIRLVTGVGPLPAVFGRRVTYRVQVVDADTGDVISTVEGQEVAHVYGSVGVGAGTRVRGTARRESGTVAGGLPFGERPPKGGLGF